MLSPTRTPWVLLLGLTLTHFVFLASFVRTAYSAPDADGYYAQARLLALESRPDFQPESPVQHLGIHWIEKEDGRFISRYPPGFSIVIGAVWKLFGRDASLYVNALLASLTLPLVFLLCRPYSGNWLALAGTWVQALDPAANRHALNADSHTLTTFCLVGGLFLLDRWGRRGGRWTALAAGFLLAYIPLVRFAEAAAAIGILAFLVLIWKRPERRAEVPFVLAGSLPPILALAAHNQFHFGAFWRTAYALTGESSLSLEYLIRNWAIYSKSLLASGVGYFVAPGVIGLLLMLRERASRPFATATSLIAASITLLYCCYYFASFGSPVTVRFLLPTLPLYLPPALYFFRTCLPGRALWPAIAALLFFQTAMGQPTGLIELRREAHEAERSAAAIAALDTAVPQGSVILGYDRLHDQLNFTGHWKLADAALIAPQPRRGPPGGPPGMGDRDDDGPSPRQRGKGAGLRAPYEALPPTEKTAAVLNDAAAWAGEADVFWVMTEQTKRRLPRLPADFELKEAGRIEFAHAPGPPRRAGGPGPPADPFGLTGEPLTIYRVVQQEGAADELQP